MSKPHRRPAVRFSLLKKLLARNDTDLGKHLADEVERTADQDPRRGFHVAEILAHHFQRLAHIGCRLCRKFATNPASCNSIVIVSLESQL